jgi:hypothetical protein
VWIPVGETIDKRPGVSTFGNALGANLRVVWATVSNDLTEAASILDTGSGLHEIWYRTSGGNWTIVPDYRDINSSVNPHEMVWVGRKLYAKGNPTGGDLIGAIIFDLDNPSTSRPWGYLRPTAAPTFTASGGWNSSGSDDVEPAIGARYAYTFETITGHETSRSPYTGKSAVVSGKYPAMTIPGDADTTNIPFINVYRTGDGGNALFFIERITNTGAGSIAYEDQNFEPDGNFSSGLNFSRPSPTETSNDPPPTVESGTIGVSAIERCSPLAQFGGRIFFAIGKNLYWSVNDEAIAGSGVLEESFRGGNFLDANRATFREDIFDLQDTSDGLYIFTARNVFMLTGELRQEIRIRTIFPGIGVYDRRCSTVAGSFVLWLDQNRELRSVSNVAGIPSILSVPLNGEHKVASRRYQLDQHAIDEYLWITVAVIDDTTPANTKYFVYDSTRQLWFPPWNIASTAIWFEFTIANGTAIGQLDLTVFTDFGSNYGATLVCSAMRIPGGNHINILRAEAAVPVLEFLEIYHIGDAPTVTVRVDALSGGSATTKSNPVATPEPTGYTRGYYYLDAIGDRFSPVLVVPSGSTLWSLLSMASVFAPNLGE